MPCQQVFVTVDSSFMEAGGGGGMISHAIWNGARISSVKWGNDKKLLCPIPLILSSGKGKERGRQSVGGDRCGRTLL